MTTPDEAIRARRKLTNKLIASHEAARLRPFFAPDVKLIVGDGALIMGVDEVIAAFPRGDFKNEFIQVQARSALKKPQTTFGTVNVDYIEYCDHTFRKPNACTRIRNTPWYS